jgi:hypothetical protein
MSSWNNVAIDAHTTAVKNGFWDDRENPKKKSELIALMHSELSEALESSRHGNPPDDKIPLYSGLEAELADTLIRIADFEQGYGLDVWGAVLAKLEFNKTRPFKHGKAF